jgi:hypothetical protein
VSPKHPRYSHTSAIFTDTRSVQLVPADIRQRAQAYLDLFSPQTADALVLMSVIRYRVLAERLAEAHGRGIRQFVILGAGLDTTGSALPARAGTWRVFEVDHPATQDWKRVDDRGPWLGDAAQPRVRAMRLRDTRVAECPRRRRIRRDPTRSRVSVRCDPLPPPSMPPRRHSASSPGSPRSPSSRSVTTGYPSEQTLLHGQRA